MVSRIYLIILILCFFAFFCKESQERNKEIIENKNSTNIQNSRTKQDNTTKTSYIGEWIGNYETRYFILTIDKQDGNKIWGTNTVYWNKPLSRLVEGNINNGKISFKEPGTDKGDGEFTGVISDNNQQFEGLWKRYQGGDSKQWCLTKMEYAIKLLYKMIIEKCSNSGFLTINPSTKSDQTIKIDKANQNEQDIKRFKPIIFHGWVDIYLIASDKKDDLNEGFSVVCHFFNNEWKIIDTYEYESIGPDLKKIPQDVIKYFKYDQNPY